jgi:Guanine nucleotide exchange factor synembryn
MPPPMAVAACNETLKLLYNVTNFYQHQAPAFSKSILPILKMLKNVPLTTPPLQPPVSSLIHALIHLDIEDKKARIFTVNQNPMFPVFDTNINIEQLIHILDLALQAYSDDEVDKFVAPLVQVLLRISEFAPVGPKARMRALLLPSAKDREKVLGQGDSLPARLLRLSAAPLAPNLRQHVPALLFELSDKDARRFVQNVGYGFAAGFLVNNGVQIPSSAMEAWSTGEADESDITNPSRRGSRTTPASAPSGSEYFDEREESITTEGTGIVEDVTEESDAAETKAAEEGETAATASTAKANPIPRMVEINPITGQRRDKEPAISEGPPMSEEEKQREAERMFVLFER